MKQSFASNPFNTGSQTSVTALRECYARIAAGARSFHQYSYQRPHTQSSANLIPVNIYQNNQSELAYLLRLLKSLTETNKWITLIAPPSNFSLSLFVQAGIQVSQIRIARPTAKHDAAALMQKAMASDTSAAVIAFGAMNQFADIEMPLGSTTTTAGFVISGVPEQLH